MIETTNGINKNAGELGWKPGHISNSHGHACHRPVLVNHGQ